MSIAYVLLNVDPGHEDELLRAVRSVEYVKEAHRIYGIYDTIVKIEADSSYVKNSIMQIRSLQHIKSTLTLTVVE